MGICRYTFASIFKMAASVARPMRNLLNYLKNAWDREPIIVVSFAFGGFGLAAFTASPYTYKQAEEMKNWPSVYNYYNLPTTTDRYMEDIPDDVTLRKVWRTDYDD